MINKDKRSLALMLLLGDGSLNNYKNYPRLTVDHGLNQADYQKWKAQLLSTIFERDVKVRTGHKGKSIQVSVCDRRLRSWYKFVYPKGKKLLNKILPFIRHPELALGVWLMDDGYVEPSFSKLADGSKKNYGARFRIFTCDQDEITQEKIIEWFQIKFNVKPKIHFQKNNKTNKIYPFLKINQEDSLKIWEIIRNFVLTFESMKYKFRHIENLYQYKLLQRTPSEN